MAPKESTFRKGVALVRALSLLVVAGCAPDPPSSDGPDPPVAPAPSFEATIVILDESSAPIAGATATLPDDQAGAASVVLSSGPDGRVHLRGLTGPVLAIIEAAGRIAEPVIVGRDDAGTEMPIRLWDGAGASGTPRIAIHFAGDTMLTRRYLTPVLAYTAVVTPGDGGQSARAVVSSVAPLFSAADLRSLNLETVVGTLPEEDAYPGKRFLLQSPPDVLHTLAELQADVVTLGNNHARDWLDPGVQSTITALDAAGLLHPGAGLTAEEASREVVLTVKGLRIGFLSYTSVNGDFVNDSLPSAGDPVPGDLPPEDAWQYEERSFGFSGPVIDIAPAPRRIGEAWSLFKTAEDGGVAAPTELAGLWAAASAIYAELQDWVARRGHGGANPYDREPMEDKIADLRAGGADLVVVQFHSGFQFVEVKSDLTESAAHAAIDAGADIVVCHHPHVLQGMEWYRGKLIAYSLGNFVFDQDFLSTFSSAVLRVVFEGGRLLEARLCPIVLSDYRPVPLAGASAMNVLQRIAEASYTPARSRRVQGAVRKILSTSSPDASPPVFIHERSSARLVEGAAARSTLSVTARFLEPVILEGPALTRSRGPGGAALTGLLLGRDLLGWGDFEDDGTDSLRDGGTHWEANESFKRVEVVEEAPSGIRCLRLRRNDGNSTRVLARPRARVSFARHRLFRLETDGSASPADGTPSFSVFFRGRLSGGGQPLVSFSVYNFDDANPTEDPESTLIRTRAFAVDLAADDEWHDVLFDIPASVLASAGTIEANAALVSVGLDPPSKGTSVLLADDVAFIEWRAPADLPDAFQAVKAVRATQAAGEVSAVLERL